MSRDENPGVHCASHRFAKQTGSYAYFAEVTVSESCDETSSNVIVELSEPTCFKQFVAGAVIGARWALEKAHRQDRVRITSVRGMLVDTTPALTALAAAEATWKLLGFEPQASLRREFDREIEATPSRHRDEAPGNVLDRIERAAHRESG